MTNLDWMYEEDPAAEAAEAENTADEEAAQFDVALHDHLYPADEY
jgi:hypothetical protein